MSNKVFVGNLSFKTRESELAHAFSTAGVNVKTANIITRGPRSLGYGFVEFDTVEDAQKAVTFMNKKTIDGLEINVELAKPRSEEQNQPRGDRNNNRGGPFRRQTTPANTTRPQNVGRGAPQQITSPTGNQNQQTSNFNQNNNFQNKPYRYPRRPRRYNNNNNRRRNPPRAQQQSQAPPAPQKNDAPRAPSSTTLFVANLPFAVKDEQLLEQFKEFNPVKAHVVVKRNNRSKGFGFVEFKDSTDQTKALQAMDKKEMSGRALIVKVALTERLDGAARTDVVTTTQAQTPPAGAITTLSAAATTEKK